MAKYNLQKLTRVTFPWFWQNDENLSLCDVVVEGVFDPVNNDYATKEAEVISKAGYSIQRYSLEESLNDQFDNTLRRIVVNQGVVVGDNFIFNDGEAIPAGLEMFIFNLGEPLPEAAKQRYFFNKNEAGGATATGFNVICPIDIAGLENEIRAWIEYPMITGTNYNLTFI